MASIVDPEYLEVNGIPLSTPAWKIASMAPLLGDAELRGSDIGMWRVTGAQGRPRYRTVTIYTFTLRVVGGFDQDGGVNLNPLQGLIDNFDFLKANLGAATETGDGTVEAIWHRPDGSTKTALVHVIGPHDVNKEVFDKATATLALSCPGAVFA